MKLATFYKFFEIQILGKCPTGKIPAVKNLQSVSSYYYKFNFGLKKNSKRRYLIKSQIFARFFRGLSRVFLFFRKTIYTSNLLKNKYLIWHMRTLSAQYIDIFSIKLPMLHNLTILVIIHLITNIFCTS